MEFRCPGCGVARSPHELCLNCGPTATAKPQPPSSIQSAAPQEAADQRATSSKRAIPSQRGAPKFDGSYAHIESFHFPDSRVTAAAALPLCAVLALLAHLSVVFAFPLAWARLWLHEMGHATSAWLAGHAATPVGFGWTNVKLEQSGFVALCVLFLLSVIAVASYRERLWFCLTIATAFILGEAYCYFILSTESWWTFMAWAGEGGGFLFSTLIIISFFHRFPEKMRWDFFRYPALVIGIYVFAKNFMFWRGAEDGDDLPWGTLIHGSDDGGGDMNRLVDAGMSPVDIIESYSTLGTICLAIILLQYSAAIFEAMRR